MKKFVEKKIEDVPLSINFGSETPLTRKPECYRKYPMIELGEVCDIQKGTSITKAKVTEGKTPVIAGGQQPAYYHNESNCEGKTITVSASGAYAGFVNYFDCPIFVSDCTTIKTKDESNLLTDFIFYLLKAKQAEIYKLQSGAAQPHVYGRDLAKIKAPLPPLPEQKAIAKVLSDTDDLIQAIEKKIAKKQLIKKGVMQKLLTPKETNKKKILRRVSMNKEATPKYVEIKDISLSINSGGGTPPTKIPEYYGGRIPWLRTQEITFNRIKETDMKITEEGLHNSSAKWIPKNSVIVAKFGATAGRSAINKIPLTTNEACCCISPDPEQCDYQYLFYILWKNYYHLERLAQGAAQRNLNGQQIKNYMILLPPLPEQKAIAKVLSDIDKQLEVLQKKLNKYKKIKQSLMQSLLTGKIRLA